MSLKSALCTSMRTVVTAVLHLDEMKYCYNHRKVLIEVQKADLPILHLEVHLNENLTVAIAVLHAIIPNVLCIICEVIEDLCP